MIDNILATDIKPSPIHGRGLFAAKAIPAGTLLCQLDGQLIRYADLLESELHTLMDPALLEWNALPDDFILLRPIRTKYSFINHAFEANCLLLGCPPSLWTQNDIAAGEELVLDYTKERLPKAYLAGHGATYLIRQHDEVRYG